jgi:hypothetical protein
VRIALAALALVACGGPDGSEVHALGSFNHERHAYEYRDQMPNSCYSCHHLQSLDVPDLDCQACHPNTVETKPRMWDD